MWVTVVGGPAFQGVRNEHVVSRQTDLREQLVEQLPGRADERQAHPVLVGPGCLADEHQVGVRVPVAEHHLGSRLVQRAPDACPVPRDTGSSELRGARRRSSSSIVIALRDGVGGRTRKLRELSRIVCDAVHLNGRLSQRYAFREAVTRRDGPREVTKQLHRRPVSLMRELERNSVTDDPSCYVPGDYRPGPARYGARRRARGRRLRRRAGRSAAALTRPAQTPCCCASPTPRSPTPPRLIAPGRWSATARAPRPRRARRPRGLLAASADDRHRRRRGVRRRRRGDRRVSTRRALTFARRLAQALGMQAGRGHRRGSHRIPRGRFDRLQLPRHARGGRRAARGDRRRRPRSCWSRWCGRRSRTGPRSDPSGR